MVDVYFRDTWTQSSSQKRHFWLWGSAFSPLCSWHDFLFHHQAQSSWCLSIFPGQILYGRVLWNPEQNLHSAYKLQLEKVYLCTGKDGYVPFFDPTGTIYNEGPQYGCIQPNKHLKHRFLLLVRPSSCQYWGGQRDAVSAVNPDRNRFLFLYMYFYCSSSLVTYLHFQLTGYGGWKDMVLLIFQKEEPLSQCFLKLVQRPWVALRLLPRVHTVKIAPLIHSVMASSPAHPHQKV